MTMVFQIPYFPCLPDHQVLDLVTTGRGFPCSPGLGARLRWALSNSGEADSTCSPKIYVSIWEKTVVGRGPSMDSGNPTMWIFCLLLRPSRLEILAFSPSLFWRSEEQEASRASIRWFMFSALDSRDVICICLWLATVACIVSSF